MSSRRPRTSGFRPPLPNAARLGPEDGARRELLARCLDGDAGAWEEFVRRYGRLIYSTVRKVGLSLEDQEEAFQETIVAIYRQLGGLRESDRLVSWIVGIAWRQSINRIRARSRETRVEEVDDEILQGSPERLDGPAPPDALRLELERAHQAHEALAALSERCRRLIGYFFYEDPPPDYSEIARREGIPIGSLGPTRARCLEKLRTYFTDRGWT